MKNMLFVGVLCLLPLSMDAAPRNHYKQQRQQCSSCVVTRANAVMPEVQKPLSERERDHAMFTGFVNILTSFVKILIDPHNIPEAKQNANNILTGINNLAHVITRRRLTTEMHDELLTYIAHYCHNHACA